MLIRFGVSNHRSIRDYQELFLSASKHIRRRGLTIPVPPLKEAIVPVVALYGPNAAGKSNLIDAMDEIQRAIVRSHIELGATDDIPRDPFRLDSSGESKPTQFDCTFTVADGGVSVQQPHEPESVFEYGFEYTATEFRREWLYRIVRKERQSTQVLFKRETEDGRVRVSVGGPLRGANRTIANLTRPNSLFLSAAAQNNHPQLTDLYRYFSTQWRVILREGTMEDVEVAERLSNYEHIDLLLQLVKQADVGISAIDVEEEEAEEKQLGFARDLAQVLSKHLGDSEDRDELRDSMLDQMRHRKRLRFIHSSAGENAKAFDYRRESKGTRALVSLLIPALDALSSGCLLVIDELDTSLHPDLARAFVSLFNKKASNPRGAQLIFSTHDVTLLDTDLVGQDQVWVTDKSEEGTSRFTPLTDYKLRSRDDIERAYRRGRLGGVPGSDEFFLDLDEGSIVAGQ